MVCKNARLSRVNTWGATSSRGLSYKEIEGVQHGGMAQAAYLEAIDPATGAARREEIDTQLRAYCALDTLAMVKVREALLA